MPVNTSAASASCGTHFGLTKLVASMVCRPVEDSRSISAIFTSAGSRVFSFCRPSRAPTSTMRTWLVSVMAFSVAAPGRCRSPLAGDALAPDAHRSQEHRPRAGSYMDQACSLGGEAHQHSVGFDEVALARAEVFDGAGTGGLQGEFHLHRFHHDQFLTFGDLITGGGLHQHDAAGHR